MYLIENPVLREAFFPETKHLLAVEPSRASDAAAILDIARRHEGPESVRSLQTWLERVPHSVSVIRGNDEAVRGFYCMAESDRVTRLSRRSIRLPTPGSTIFAAIRWNGASACCCCAAG